MGPCRVGRPTSRRPPPPLLCHLAQAQDQTSCSSRESSRRRARTYSRDRVRPIVPCVGFTGSVEELAASPFAEWLPRMGQPGDLVYPAEEGRTPMGASESDQVAARRHLEVAQAGLRRLDTAGSTEPAPGVVHVALDGRDERARRRHQVAVAVERDRACRVQLLRADDHAVRDVVRVLLARAQPRDVGLAVDLDPRIAFLGTYPPRRCGIATFTRDLAAGMTAAECTRQTPGRRRQRRGGSLRVPGGGRVPDPPGNEGRLRARRRAGQLQGRPLGLAAARVRHLRRRRRLLRPGLLNALRVPAMVTLHTVLDRPSESQRTIVQRWPRRRSSS